MDPSRFECLFNLGVIAQETGRAGLAVDLIGQAIAVNDRVPHFHNSLGNALKSQGRLDEATAAYQRAIALKPDLAQAHLNLALVFIGQGRLDEAARSCRQAIAVNPDFAEAHNNLGNIVKDQGEPDEALAAYERAIMLKPDFAQAHYNRALVVGGQGRLDDATTSYERAIALEPGFVEAHNNLGKILKDRGRLDEAVASCQRAIALRPSFAQAHFCLALALEKQGKFEEAIESYSRAIALKPDFAEAHSSLGNLLLRQGRVEEAAVCLARAAELETGRAEIWFFLGRALGILGDMQGSRAALLRAAELDPQAEETIYAIAGVQPMSDGSPEAATAFALMSRLTDNIDQLPAERRPPAMLAMSKALEERGEFDRAFALMAEANAILRADQSFDVAGFERRTQAIAMAYDGLLLERLEGEGLVSERPIFIVGMPRSGTTLIEQIISAHPKVYGAGEIPNLWNALAAVGGADVLAHPSRVTAVDGDGRRALAQTYLDSLPPASPGQTRVTDKYLANLELIGLIHLCLPGAKIIHCRRDPRDACFSCYGSRFIHGHPYSNDLIDLGRYWRAYDRLMSHWRTVLPPGRILEVSYEAVVEDLDTWATRLIAHCGLDWDDACLRFYESERAVKTASLAQVRRPIYASSVGRWRPFARHLVPLLEALGEPWSQQASV